MKNIKKTAEKLHKQFAHPTADKLIKLLRNAGHSNQDLEDEIRSLSLACEVCLRFKRNPSRPVVSLPLANKFNDVIAMDLKSYGSFYFLVIVDLFTRYCSAIVLPNKMSPTVIRGVFKGWITFFGAPQKIISDNGREFNSDQFQTFAEAFNIKLLNTAAESPWSNGVCEKMNDVLGKAVNKIIEDSGCDLETALAWAVSARNSLDNFSGFSPNQLAFGHNPAMPTNFENFPPALENVESSDIVRCNLSALHAARKEFVRIESDERIRRALRSNVRMSNIGDIKTGDEVFYKRNNSDRWHGPATVTGIDGKQMMVRHGGNLHRVHICRLKRKPSSEHGTIPSIVKNVENSQSRIENNMDSGDDFIESDDEEAGVSTEREVPSDQDDGDAVANDVEASATTAEDSNDNYQPMKNWKKGERFQGRDADTGQLITGKIMSRAGKAKGINKHCYNIVKDCGWSGWCDLSALNNLQEIADTAEMIVLYSNDAISKAKDKEMENWCSNSVYEEVPNEGQKLISTRWVVTEKVKEGKTITKARLVARGFEENTSSLRKDSPTCSRESVRILLAIAASNQWICNVVDVKAAYLQGNVIEREVYLKPPPEYDMGEVWKLKKTVYGLCDAARAWYLRVKDEFVALKVVMCSLDNSLFSWYNQGKLEGIICIYVDDFLWAGTELFEETIIAQLKSKFLIGSSGSATFRYIGLNITSHDQYIYVDQGQYISSLEKVSISRSRSCQKDSLLSDTEKEAFKAIVGQLNWISTNTRPDISYEVCELSSSYNKATVSDLLRLNKVIEIISKDVLMLCFPRLLHIERCQIEVFSDASFANLPDGGSQGAIIVFLKDENGQRCPLYWQTRRLKRVVKSTLAAETMALLEGAEAGVYLANILKEVLGVKMATVSCITDNKSLVDSLYSTKRVDDKRLRIDMAVLRDMIDREEVFSVSWVDTHKQLADCMTKRGASTERLRAALTKN